MTEILDKNFGTGIWAGIWYSLDAGLYNIFDKKYQDNQSIYEPARYFSLKMNARF